MNENIEIIEIIETDEQIEATEQVGQDELLDEMTDEELAALVSQPVQVELTLEQIVDQVLDATWKSAPTLYTWSTALNGVLEVLGATKVNPKTGKIEDYRVRSQMVYNYNRNKMLARDEKSGKGIQIDGAPTRDQARAHIIKFAAKFI